MNLMERQLEVPVAEHLPSVGNAFLTAINALNEHSLMHISSGTFLSLQACDFV